MRLAENKIQVMSDFCMTYIYTHLMIPEQRFHELTDAQTVDVIC